MSEYERFIQYVSVVNSGEKLPDTDLTPWIRRALKDFAVMPYKFYLDYNLVCSDIWEDINKGGL